MIGQSGLPMMNNLAGSKEKTPEETKAVPPTVEAGAFEQILMPGSQTFVDETLPNATADSTKAAESAVTQSQAELIQQVTPPIKAPTDVEAPVQAAQIQQFVELATATAEDESAIPLNPKPNDGNTLIARESDERELYQGMAGTPEAMSNSSSHQPKVPSETLADSSSPQTAALGSKAAQPDIQDETAGRSIVFNGSPFGVAKAQESQVETTLPAKADQSTASNNSQLDVAKTPENQPNTTAPSSGSALNEQNSLQTKLAASSEMKSSQVTVPASEAESQLSLQSSPLPASYLADTGPVAVATAKDNGVTNVSSPVYEAKKPETDIRLATGQLAEKNMQLSQEQIEVVQDRHSKSSSLSELRSTSNLYGVSLLPGHTQKLTTTSSAPSELTGLKGVPFAQSIQPMKFETSGLSLTALSEPSEVSLGSMSAVSSTAQSRLDTSVGAPLPQSSDAKLVIQQINQAIIRMDGTRTEITLDPVELGRVSLTFITKDEGVTVVINADRSETADLLRRNGEQLQRDLSNAGYEGVELDFNQGDGGQQGSPTTDRLDDNGAAQTSSASYEAKIVTSGLDIRI